MRDIKEFLYGLFEEKQRALSALFLFLLFSIPFGTRTVILQWRTPFSEYESFSLWGTDFLFLILLLLVLIVRIKRPVPERVRLLENVGIPAVAVLLFLLALISTLLFGIRAQAILQVLKFGEFLVWFLLARSLASEIRFSWVVTALILGGFVQSLIAIGQFALQHSLGLAILGESVLDPNMPGVAKIDLPGLRLLRSYGTLPHPNVLGAYLVTAISALWVSALLYHGDRDRRWQKRMLETIVLVLVSFFLFLGLFFTFSRASIYVFFSILILLSLFLILRRSLRIRIPLLLVIFGLLAGLVVTFFTPFPQERLTPSVQEQAVSQRLFLQGVAGKMLVLNPLLGVGVGQFVPVMRELLPGLRPWQYEPAHNLYLLVLAELGVFGALAFLFIILAIFVPAALRALWYLEPRILLGVTLVVAFLLLGLFDHYFWTIQQGRFLWWFALGYLSGLIRSR